MSSLETSLGGPIRAFPDTTWGVVSRLQSPAEYRAGLETLCSRYWKPVYSFARAAWAKSNEDAKDLTQAFFLWLMDDDVLSRYTPERGSFRAYLKGLLRNFSGNQYQAMQRLKRGGDVRRIALDEANSQIVADTRAGTPEEAFDRTWIGEVVRRATDRARGEVSPEQWRVFEAYDLAASPERPTYEEVARQLRVKESDVRNRLFAVRDKIRHFLREELRDTVASDEDVQEEWGALFGS